MQQGAEGLIDKEAQYHVQKALKESKGHVEYQKTGFFSKLFVQQGTEGLIDQEAQYYVQQTLKESKGHVEYQETSEQDV